MGLLLIGQLFLLTHPLRKGEAVVFEPRPVTPTLYVMAPSDAADSKTTDTGRAVSREKTAGDDRKTGAGVAVRPVAVPSMKVTSFIQSSEQPFKQMIFEFSGPIRVTKMNREGKLLRLKFQPGIASLSTGIRRQLNEILERFSAYDGASSSEWVLYGRGPLGEPVLGTGSANISRLIVPYRAEDEGFPVPGGEELERGLQYYVDRPVTKQGPSDAYILRLDAWAAGLSLFPVLANEGICQKEVLSSMAKRYQAVAGINAAYFTNRGDPIGTLIINRKLVSSPLYHRSVFGITDRGWPVFGNPDFSGKLLWNKQPFAITAVNQARSRDSLVIFTPEFGRSTMTTGAGIELVLVKNRVVGIQAADSLIPPDGVVVAAGADQMRFLSNVRLGDQVQLDYQIHSPWDRIQHAVCGGPRLLHDGGISINGREEKFDPGIVTGRHPRSAVAYTYNGDILLVVIDGRSRRSAGMTLAELADYLKRLGARNAINLDGGGSSSMFIRGRIVNRPSDGKERPISNGILITKQ